MTKLKYLGLVKAYNALFALSEQDKAKSYVLPSATRIRLGGNLSRLKAIIDDIQKEQNKLFETYGTPNDKGLHEVKKTSEKWDEFEKAYRALQDEEFEVEIKPMTETELINSRVVKARDEKGHVTESTVENQVTLDVISDLISVEALTA